jgi:colicin import membrane protein
MEEEQRLLAAQQEQQTLSTVQKYTALIREKVENVWRKPATSKQGLKCTVYVRLIPGGDVMHVEVTKSSGDASFDRSVETAVQKAVPLPLPADPALFEKFREITFVFDPDQKTS